MQERLRSFFGGLLDKFNNLENGQKVKLGISALVVILVLGVTTYFLTRPNLVMLYDKLTYSDAGQIKAALDDAGIYNKITTTSNGSAIFVNAADNDQAQVEIGTKNLPATQDFTHADAFKTGGMSATESTRQEAFKLASESATARKLRLFEGVTDAAVTITPADNNSFFIDEKSESSISVILTLMPGYNISSANALGMANFLRGTVEGLKLENVYILDQNMNPIYSGQTPQESVLGSAYELELQKKRELEASLRNQYLPLFDKINVSSNIVFNTDKQSVKSSTLTPPVPDTNTGVPTREETHKSNFTGGNADAEPGVQPNTQTTPTYATGNNTQSSASTSDSIIDRAYNTEETFKELGTGVFMPELSSLSATFYKYRNYDEATITEAQLNGMTWAEFKATTGQALVPLTIDPQIIESIQKGTGIADVSVTGYEVPMFTDAIVKPLQISQIVMMAILVLLIGLLAFGLIKKTQADEVTEVEPELSVEDLLVSTQLEEEKEEEMRLKEIEFNKESETKLQIEKFIQERPESVASLLRNWLNEEWE